VPPLHVNCRCQRVRAVTEWRTRQVEAWRLRWTTRAAWEWQITGWQCEEGFLRHGTSD
jgi:hypothetical protein